MNPVIRPSAREDILRQFRWYLVEQDAPDTALRFVDAVDESVEQLLRMPNMGAPRELKNPALKGLPPQQPGWYNRLAGQFLDEFLSNSAQGYARRR